ncbi:beta-1,3-galactosyltransferase 2-like isoform X1 [Micropterus salmoides]|uniref:beta-1,3-galactosyltransferase 2-like isoform X1 n=1 Tax=Micropterus salmoides TaxID=27706 RepID=UPI0018EE0AD1|nr:beta-1,3-galactosyltransferase 2-like isoform X1 [Micropterus salmoides]
MALCCEILLVPSKMLENSLPKCKKTPWTRARRWVCFLMLFLVMGTSALIFYNSSPQVSWPLNVWTIKLLPNQSHNNVTPSVSIISPADLSQSEYFVPYPHQYHFILDEPNRCQQESPFLVLMIPVAPHNREARDIIRSTWGKEIRVLGQVISHYFLLGLSKEEHEKKPLEEEILKESQRHHDILQSDFLDSYRNLTIKTMVMFEWLSSHCPNTSYAMKVDSDMFLNIHNLVNMLLKAPRHLYMTGQVLRGVYVLRDSTSKWFLPVSAFPESTYPSYALGMGYVFSLDLPKKIVEASAHVKAVYIEDVYVGLCMRHLGLSLTDPPHGLFIATIPFFRGSCYWTSVITTLLENSNQLANVWITYQTQTQSGC